METSVATQNGVSTKVVESKTIFYHEGTTTLNEIHDYANGGVEALMQEVERNGLEPQGPLEFIYFGATADMDKSFTLQIALPVKAKKEVGKGFRFRETAPFRCLSYDYHGDLNKVSPVYEMLYQHLAANQQEASNEIREVYKQWEHMSSANNITEIQIGLK